jgi:hypothetical protein
VVPTVKGSKGKGNTNLFNYKQALGLAAASAFHQSARGFDAHLVSVFVDCHESMTDAVHEAWTTSFKDKDKQDAWIEKASASTAVANLCLPFDEILQEEERKTLEDAFRRYRRVLAAYRLWGWDKEGREEVGSKSALGVRG